MSTETHVTGRLIGAARVLSGISVADFADASGIPVEPLERMEASGSAWLPSGNEVETVNRALEKFGVLFVPEGDGIGAGVRLRFTRQDVRQISRLESEGGIARIGDVL